MTTIAPVSTPAPVPGDAGRPTPDTLDDAGALAIFNRRFDAFDTAAKQDGADGKVSREDLQYVADHSDDPELVATAEYLLGNPPLRERLDVAGEGGDTDGLISRKDLTSAMVRSAPASMPLLQEKPVQGSSTNPTVLDIQADPPAGASWANEDGQGPRAGIVSVYVDGRYVGDATIFAENDGRAQVNLGVLGEGAHTVELRDSSAVGTGAPDAGIDADTVDVQARELDIASSDAAERDQALAAKYAPNLALADENQATDNTPLMTTAQVRHNEDGTTTLSYRILYSNEDGGDGTDPDLIANRWGRTTDDERVYEVTVSADGERVLDFGSKGLGDDPGELDDAQGAGELPAIAISNDHNNVRWDDDGRHRAFSGVPVLVEPGPDQGSGDDQPGPPSNAIMRDHPWTWRVANAEMDREHKLDDAQPYQRLYLSQGQGSFDADTTIVVHLRNGQEVELGLDDANGRSNSVSVVLPAPPSEIERIEVAGSGGSGIEAYYLASEDLPVDVPVD